MSMFEVSEDDIRKMYTDADEQLQARELRNHMASIIREAMKDVVHEVGYGDATTDYFQNRADLTLECLLRVCSEKGWERIGRPIMAKIEAEHQKRLALESMTLNAALNPMPIQIPSSFLSAFSKITPQPTQPVDE